jgi:hypothetical protein
VLGLPPYLDGAFVVPDGELVVAAAAGGDVDEVELEVAPFELAVTLDPKS